MNTLAITERANCQCQCFMATR